MTDPTVGPRHRNLLPVIFPASSYFTCRVTGNAITRFGADGNGTFRATVNIEKNVTGRNYKNIK